MLPASQTNNPPPRAAPDLTVIVAAVAVLMLYTLAVGLALLGGAMLPSTGNLLMIFPCLAMFLWYGYGYGKESSEDGNLGLLLSLGGWALGAVAFLLRFTDATRIEAVLATGVPQNTMQSDWPASAIFCLLLALALIVAGAYYAWRGSK